MVPMVELKSVSVYVQRSRPGFLIPICTVAGGEESWYPDFSWVAAGIVRNRLSFLCGVATGQSTVAKVKDGFMIEDAQYKAIITAKKYQY